MCLTKRWRCCSRSCLISVARLVSGEKAGLLAVKVTGDGLGVIALVPVSVVVVVIVVAEVVVTALLAAVAVVVAVLVAGSGN